MGNAESDLEVEQSWFRDVVSCKVYLVSQNTPLLSVIVIVIVLIVHRQPESSPRLPAPHHPLLILPIPSLILLRTPPHTLTLRTPTPILHPTLVNPHILFPPVKILTPNPQFPRRHKRTRPQPDPTTTCDIRSIKSSPRTRRGRTAPATNLAGRTECASGVPGAG